MPPCPGLGRRLPYSRAAQPGNILPSSPLLRSWVLMSTGQCHSLWSTNSSWQGLAIHEAIRGDAQRYSFYPEGSLRKCWGWGLSLCSPSSTGGLWLCAEWGESGQEAWYSREAWRPSWEALKVPHGATLAAQGEPGLGGCSGSSPHPTPPHLVHPCEPHFCCLAHSWVCPLLRVPLGSMIGSSGQVDVSLAVSHQEMSSPLRHTAVT